MDKNLVNNPCEQISLLKSKAYQALEKNQIEWARECFFEAFQLNPSEEVACLEQWLLCAEASLKHSWSWIDQFDYGRKSFKLYVNLIYAWVVLKPLNQILNLYEVLLKHCPTSKWVLLSCSKIYESKGWLNHATILLEGILRYHSKQIKTMKHLGQLYYQQKRYEEAKRVYILVLDLKPNDQESQKALKNIMANLSLDASKQHVTSFISKLKDEKQLTEVALEFKSEKTIQDWKWLIEQKEKKLKVNPLSMELKQQLLELYNKVEQNDKAYELIQDLIKQEPHDLDLRLKALQLTIQKDGKAMRSDGIDQQAKQRLKNGYLELLQEFPTQVELKYRLARLCFELEDNDEALKWFQGIQHIERMKSEAYYYIGQILYRKQMLDLAIDELKTGISHIPTCSSLKMEMVYYLASILESSGKIEEALIHYKTLFKLDASYKDVKTKIEQSYPGFKNPT